MTSLRIALGTLALLAAVTAATAARAEDAAWDQERVTTLAEQLRQACGDLYDSFYKQPTPTVGMQVRSYYELKQQVRRLRSEARELSAQLENGAGHDETLPIYQNLMLVVREARDNAARVFTTESVQKKATAARDVLNQITPYYDPDAKPLEPVTR